MPTAKRALRSLLPPVIASDTVYLSDCITGMRRMTDESVDLIVSDPPYLINYATGHRQDKAHDFCTPIQNDSNPELIQKYVEECYRILKPNCAFYMFCSAKTQDFFKTAAQNAHFTVKNAIVWVKSEWTMGDLKAQFGQQYEVLLLLNKGRAPFNGKRLGDVWEFPGIRGRKQLHQNQKPVELIQRCIEKHSKEGDVVFDGFMGSGTTAVAAARMNRHFIGFEIEPRYFWIIHNRLCEEV
jgi:site-specific DNA-methyltransferase (adenine-specific)